MESSWFWEDRDMVYSQMETIPWGGGGGVGNAERGRMYTQYGNLIQVP